MKYFLLGVGTISNFRIYLVFTQFKIYLNNPGKLIVIFMSSTTVTTKVNIKVNENI